MKYFPEILDLKLFLVISAHLVYGNITNDEKISCQKSSESNNTTNNVFGSLFATVLGSETSQSKTVTDTTLLVNLLKLSSILVHTKVQQPVDVSIDFDDSFCLFVLRTLTPSNHHLWMTPLEKKKILW